MNRSTRLLIEFWKYCLKYRENCEKLKFERYSMLFHLTNNIFYEGRENQANNQPEFYL